MKIPGQGGYPKVLDIGGEVWAVRFKKCIEGDERILGLCDPDKQTIYICSQQTKREMFRTFIHEAAHALEAVWEIKIKHKQVYRLEKAIARFILDNY